MDLNGSSLTECDCANAFNRFSRYASLAYVWTQRYPSRAAGWMYLVPALAFTGSSALRCATGEMATGGSLLAAGLCQVFGSLALMRWGDPEIRADGTGEKFTDIQDLSLWRRLIVPHKAPHEFAALLGVVSTGALVMAAAADPTVTSVVMATSCVFGTVASVVAEKTAERCERAESSPRHVFNRLADAGRAWVQERPLRAAFWMFAPCNVAQIADGISRPGGTDFWMIFSGAAYLSINAVRGCASKRIRVLPPEPATLSSPT